MAEVATAVAAAVGIAQAEKPLWAPVLDTIRSSNDMKEIYAGLSEAISMLGAVRDDNENEIQRDKSKKPSKTYDQWINKVVKLEVEVKNLLTRYDKERKRSRIICFLPRSDFSNQMKKKGEKIVELIEAGNQLKILAEQPPEPVIKLTAPNIKKYSTLQKPLEQTLELLKNEQVKGIRIVGMMGTGKTAIMRNLNNHEEVAEGFDIVMWMKVSMEESEENLSIDHLRKSLAERLKMDLTGITNSDDITQRISNELKDKKYLLLLDDVKDDLQIHQIGIPSCANGSKVVLTTRWNHVCSSLVNRLVKVNYLSQKESWRMFQDVLNRPDLENHPKVGPLVWKIVNECGGHPLLIRTIASVFKMKDDETLWGEGFNSLKRFSEKEHYGMKEMCRVIKFCYDDLKDNQRRCFLYGTLYPEDSDIYANSLLECWEAEDFLGNNSDAREANINGHDILKHLKNRSLLEVGKSEKYVTMHKCIRQVALYIASDDPNCKQLVKTNGAFLPDLEANCWVDKNQISLVESGFEKLPDSPECSMLSTLFLQKNLHLKSIPALFFTAMRSLKILDLCHTGISCLPSSFSELISLKVLYLSHCKKLSELPLNIGELKHLQVLDIRGSGFSSIPCHIDSLKALKRLRVSFFANRNESASKELDVNCGIISRMSALEELVIDVKSTEKWSNEVVKRIIKDMATLEHMTSLQFCFVNEVVDVIEVVATILRVHVPKAEILQTFLEETRSWRNVQRISSFHFFIGCQDKKQPCIPEFYQYDRYVKYCEGDDKNNPVFELLNNVEALELANHKNIKKLSDLGIPAMNQVRGCLVDSCDALETALDMSVLPNLEHFYLANLRSLSRIWNDGVEVSRLKTLVLSRLHMVKSIFPLVVIQQLSEIEYIKVEDCSEVTEVVENFSGAVNMGFLPSLEKLILLDLPKLESICTYETSRWSSLEKLKVRNCPALKKLPFRPDDKEKLRLVKADQRWLEALQW